MHKETSDFMNKDKFVHVTCWVGNNHRYQEKKKEKLQWSLLNGVYLISCFRQSYQTHALLKYFLLLTLLTVPEKGHMMLL